MEEKNRLLKSALWYLERGYSLIPINPGTKEPFHGFKWERYKKTRPTQKEVRAWWGKWPNANIALVLGDVSKLIALDIDDAKALNGHELPTTPKAISGGKRMPHYYFEYVPGSKNYTRLESKSEKFSIRCEGRYIIAPPSKHQSGGLYEWAPGLGIHEIPLAKPPDWMMELMSRNGEEESQVFNPDPEFSEIRWQAKREKILEIIPPYWTKGERQELSMCLAGFLAKQGLPWAHTNKLILEIAKLSKDNETGQRIGAIKATYKKAQAGKAVKGYKGLEEILSHDDLHILSSLFDTPKLRVEKNKEGYHGMSDREIIELTAFPFDIFSAELKEVIRITSESLEVEQEVVAGIMLGLISGAVGNSVKVSPKPGYCVPLFLWMLIVAESGYGRSPTLKELAKPIKEWQAERHTVYEQAVREYERSIRAARKDSETEIPDKPQVEHYFLSDTTVEALAKAFESTPRGIILYQDELSGLIFGLNQYKGGKGNDRQHYLELWDCDSWKIDRKGESRYIRNTGASILGGIQPRIMPQVFSQDSFDDGLLPRFLFINAENKPLGFARQGIDDKYLTHWSTILKSCYSIPISLDDNGFVKPEIVRLAEEAIDAWAGFYNEMGQTRPFLSERARVFIPKLLHYGLKLAGILHILKDLRKEKEVNRVNRVNSFLKKSTIENAILLTRYFCGQAINILDLYNKEKPLSSQATRLIRAIYGLQGEVQNGRLLFSKIVAAYNTNLPKKLQQTPQGIGGLINSELKLTTRNFEHNTVYLLWEEDKLKPFFYRNKLTQLTKEDNPPDLSSSHSEACDCSECCPNNSDDGKGSFELIGDPVTDGVRTIQKARSRSGEIIYNVTEPQNDGVSRARWVYPSDRDYKELKEWEEDQI